MHAVLSFIKKVLYSIVCYVRGDIVLNSWTYYGVLYKANNNFGDDINVPIIKALTGKNVSIYNSIWTNKQNLLCIGSVVEKYCNKNSVIWGSGAMHGNRKLKGKPLKVFAVRGPLTEKYLKGQGVDCPPVYGDPALLLPCIYSPNMVKKYKIGIIPHYLDYDLPHVASFRENHSDILFIKLKDYSSWTDVIDQIVSCEYIISSSLHGLIVSDAFNVPNVRVKFSNRIDGGDFKYKDYMGGVNRKYREPIDCLSDINLDVVLKEFAYYKPIKFDVEHLITAFPYKLSKNFIRYRKHI